MPKTSKTEIARVALIKRGVPVQRTPVPKVAGTEAIVPGKDEGSPEGPIEGPAGSETFGQPEDRAATLLRDMAETDQQDLTEADTVRDGARTLGERTPKRLAG